MDTNKVLEAQHAVDTLNNIAFTKNFDVKFIWSPTTSETSNCMNLTYFIIWGIKDSEPDKAKLLYKGPVYGCLGKLVRQARSSENMFSLSEWVQEIKDLNYDSSTAQAR